MISIKKRRQIKFLIKSLLILIIIISSIVIYGFYPYGLHKKYMHKVKMPKDSIAYISVKNLNDSLLKFSNKIQMPMILEIFNNYKNDSNLLNRIIFSILTKRNSSILLWQYNNDLKDLESFYFLDTGKLIGFFANNFFNFLQIKEFDINGIKYNINKINYDDLEFFIIENDEHFLYLAFYKGVLIVTKNYINLKKIIYFFSSKTPDLKDIYILNKISFDYNPDISFYLNKDFFNKNFFDFKKLNFPQFFDIVKFFQKDIYGNIKFYEINAKLNIFTEENSFTNINIDLK